MNEGMILKITNDALLETLIIAAPVLLVSMIIGLIISIFQTTTSIQEQTLTFVPKIVAIFAVIIIFGSWMGTRIINYTLQIFNLIPNLLK